MFYTNARSHVKFLGIKRVRGIADGGLSPDREGTAAVLIVLVIATVAAVSVAILLYAWYRDR